MKFDFSFACDQLSSTNHSALLEVSSSASCKHILTKCIHSCTYMDTLPLKKISFVRLCMAVLQSAEISCLAPSAFYLGKSYRYTWSKVKVKIE